MGGSGIGTRLLEFRALGPLTVIRDGSAVAIGWDVGFSRDGSKLVSGGGDGIARVWALDLDDLIDIARRELTRPLTDEECRQYLHLDSCTAAR